MPNMGNGCMSYALTMKFVRAGKELWAFFQASDGDGKTPTTSGRRTRTSGSRRSVRRP